MKVLAEIPLDLDEASLRRQCRIAPRLQARCNGLGDLPAGSDADEFADLLRRARRVARPKALYKEAFVDARGGDSVTIDCVTFRSPVLRGNLDRVERVFPYVATCGAELDRIDLPAGDFLKQYWLDVIKAAVLGLCVRHLSDYLHRAYALGKTAVMSPGSGDASVWPIEQQRELFALFGDVEERIGVVLTDSFLMVPNKTVSGIRFPTEVDYRSCRLCRRAVCPGRSAPFDEDLWRSFHPDADGDGAAREGKVR